jgi:hypothetical protein
LSANFCNRSDRGGFVSKVRSYGDAPMNPHDHPIEKSTAAAATALMTTLLLATAAPAGAQPAA